MQRVTASYWHSACLSTWHTARWGKGGGCRGCLCDEQQGQEDHLPACWCSCSLCGGEGAPGHVVCLHALPAHLRCDTCTLSYKQRRLQEEYERCAQYLEPGTRRPLVAVVERQLVAAHMAAVLDKGFAQVGRQRGDCLWSGRRVQRAEPGDQAENPFISMFYSKVPWGYNHAS
jgi:hypothetical protein